ncbi:MAG: TonB family protein [Candidatus Sericytochromatia bacterium]|nr:TonB family protein [Candidatus Sericytochromatia bacterium]
MTPSERPARNVHPGSAYARRKGLSGYGGGAGRARRKAPVVRGADPQFRWTARGVSLGLHVLVAALLLAVGPLQPAPPEQARKPVTVVEVEFVDLPAPRPAKAAAPAPATKVAKAAEPPAPVRPVPEPRPEVAARPKPAARRVARPVPQTRPQPVREAPQLVSRPAPPKPDLRQLAAARRRGAETDPAARLAALRQGVADPNTAPGASRPGGQPSVTQAAPYGDLAGRGVAYAPRPTYPAAAQEQALEGRVSVQVFVSPEGRVLEARVSESSGYPAIDRAALTAAGRYRFVRREGTQTEQGVIPFDFRID